MRQTLIQKEMANCTFLTDSQIAATGERLESADTVEASNLRGLYRERLQRTLLVNVPVE